MKGTSYICHALGCKHLFPERSHFSEFGLNGAEMITRASLNSWKIIINNNNYAHYQFEPPNSSHFRHFLA